jgi:hypothetical protein
MIQSYEVYESGPNDKSEDIFIASPWSDLSEKELVKEIGKPPQGDEMA